MWRTLRDELHPQGFELITVGMDTLGEAGCGEFIRAASPTHPALLDQHHELARLFGVINIPSAIWIDEQQRIVRPAEAAPAPPQAPQPAAEAVAAAGVPERLRAMGAEAAKIPNDAKAYHDALRDWVERGSDSRFAMTPEQAVARSQPRDANVARGHAHFELASHCELNGDHQGAVLHFRAAHALVPHSWTYRRQAWSLEAAPELGPLKRFWQGPNPDAPEAWPYEGDWLSDVRAAGAENYNPRFEA